MKSPLFGSFYQSQSKNIAGQESINVYADGVSQKSGGTEGALYMTPGLTFNALAGVGPVRGMLELRGSQTIYIVSGGDVYSLSQLGLVTSIGTIGTTTGPISMTQNGQQLMIVDGKGAYLVPGGFPLTGGKVQTGGMEYAVGDTIILVNQGGAWTATTELTVTSVSPPGYPLSGGETTDGGEDFNVGDIITLAPADGTQNTPASIKVTAIGGGYGLTGGTPGGTEAGYAVDDVIVLLAVGAGQTTAATIVVTSESGGAVTGFLIGNHGIFPSQPTSFVQASTTGSGTGFTLTSPTFSSSTGSQVAAFTISSGGSFSVQPTSFTQASTSGSGSGFTLGTPTYGPIGPGGAVTGFKVTLTGAFNPVPTQFTQASTSGSGDGLVITAPTYGDFVPIYIVELPFLNPSTIVYQDGFGLLSFLFSNIIAQSNLFDLSYWDQLIFSKADGLPDEIQALVDLHEQVFVLKEESLEVWANAGSPGFAFQREPGVTQETGCCAIGSVAKVGESICFLARNQEGWGIVVRITGYEPETISTPAIEDQIGSYQIMTDAIGYGAMVNGRLFYILTFPTGNTTWAYDTKTRLWHKWAYFENGVYSRHLSNCAVTAVDGSVLVGDYRNGNIYVLDPNATTDNGQPRRWYRSWSAVGDELYDPARFSSLQINMTTGIGVDPNLNPQMTLRWSDDGGYTWSNELFASAGKTGKTGQRMMFRRLGSTKRDRGLNRIFRIESTDVWNVAIYGADLK
jgi:hypothetical protein